MAEMSEQPKTIRLADYRAPDFLVDTVDLTFELEPDKTRVESRLKMRRNGAHGRPLVLDGDELKLVSVSLNGKPLAEGAYKSDPGRLEIPTAADAFDLTVVTEVAPAANTKLSGLYVSSGTFCTQCEAEGFRRITYFPDRPDVMATYTTTIRADKKRYPVLLSNGNQPDEKDLGDGRHEAIWRDPHKKPSYLFALVAGDLVHVEDWFTTRSGRKVRLRIYVEHGNEKRCDYAMDSLKRSMKWDEDVFGLEYDLDLFNIVAVGEFNMGAMENKGLNVFNSKYILADPETATDGDYAGIETVVAHEYFHNWTGNRITCRDWFQLSLKEGLTVFRDQKFTEDMRSAAVARIQQVRSLRARQFPEDSGPLAHPVRPAEYIEINNFYTPTVYEKGAELIRMMHSLLGKERFRKGMDLYVERHDGQAVTCDDFVAAMQDASGVDLSRLKRWYHQAGTPEVAVEGRFDDLARAYEMTVTQTVPPTPGQPDKEPMHIPFAVGLLDRRGNEMPLRFEGESLGAEASTRLLDVTEAKQTFRFLNVGAPPALSLNRGFSAPVRVTAPLDDKALAFLMANDRDTFARWEAGQQYATRLLLGMIAEIQAKRTPQVDPAFIEAIGRVLADTDLDKAFVAQMVVLPSEDYIADQMAVVDVEAIHRAREQVKRSIAEKLREPLLAIYEGNRSNAPYSPDAEQAGRRALRNAALAYLATLDKPAFTALAAAQYRESDNMTDRMAALAVLNDRESEQRRTSLDDFYERFQKQALVVDKWLALQATSALPDTLERVRKLLEHPAFSIKNPNKVRALIGSFASANALRFHAADGKGYDFLADQVLELEPLNPQVAARIVQPLGRWRRFDKDRQAKMKAALERVLAKPTLSRDVYEIASKSLKG